MKPEDVYKQIEELPTDDKEFIIGWLVAQIVYLDAQLREKRRQQMKQTSRSVH